eukprot:1356643-Prymnesium_polylepis.1
MQPQGDLKALFWSTGILDYREANFTTRRSHTPRRPTFAWLNGLHCDGVVHPKDGCRACAGSEMQKRCTHRDWQSWCDVYPPDKEARRVHKTRRGVNGSKKLWVSAQCGTDPTRRQAHVT